MENHNSKKNRNLSNLVQSLCLCWSSKRSRTLCVVLLSSVFLALVLPLINLNIVYPAFTDVIVKGIEEDARRLGAHMLPPSLKHTKLSTESLSQDFFGEIYKLEHNFDLMKIKIFSSEGKTIYSTEPTDIGHLNTKTYFKNIVAKGQSYTKLVTKDARTLEGEKAHYDVVETYVPFMNGDEFLGAFEIYYDITKRTERMNQLVFYSGLAMAILAGFLILAVIFLLRKEVGHQLAQERADALKDDVERIMRHDLKSPLISLLSGVTYLEHFTELDEEQKEIASDMRTAINTAMDMINRSLDLYKMETGMYQYEPTAMDLLELVRQVVSDLAAPAITKNVAVLVTLNGSVPNPEDTFPVMAEAPLCYSLIANLLKNAIEASSSGDRVTISLREGKNILITVHNPAVVPEAIRDIFFEKYATAGKASGTGIGTYSAQLMATTMGGTIAMTTSEENGTRIKVTLPLIEINPETISE